MKIRLSVLAVAIAVLVSRQAVNAQPPGPPMPAGCCLPGAGNGPQLAGCEQDNGCGGDPSFSGRNTGCDPWQISAGYLYLRPRNVEVAYGVPTSDAVIARDFVPTQVGDMGVVDGRYDPGFRIGLSRAIGEWSSVGVVYSHFDTSSTSELTVAGTGASIFPMVVHPELLDTNPFFDTAVAQQNIDFRILDAQFRNVFASGYQYDLAFVGGARYVELRQSTSFGFFTPGAVAGNEFVFTHIKFDGGGIRLGLEGERRAANSGLMVYGKTAASFVAGDFRADFIESTDNNAPTVGTSWRAGRIVSILDLEVGAGWTSPGGRLRMTTGYMVSGWFNTVKSANWIHAVQTNNVTGLQTNNVSGLNDTITFDGLVSSVELRF